MYIWYLYFFLWIYFLFSLVLIFHVEFYAHLQKQQSSVACCCFDLFCSIVICVAIEKKAFLVVLQQFCCESQARVLYRIIFVCFFDDKKNYVLSLYFNIYVKLILFHKIIRFIGIWLLWYWKVLWQQNPFIVHNEDYLMIWMYSTCNNFW